LTDKGQDQSEAKYKNDDGRKMKTLYEVWEERHHDYEEIRKPPPRPRNASDPRKRGGSRTARW
jgi:hypothetical protein